MSCQLHLTGSISLRNPIQKFSFFKLADMKKSLDDLETKGRYYNISDKQQLSLPFFKLISEVIYL